MGLVLDATGLLKSMNCMVGRDGWAHIDWDVQGVLTIQYVQNAIKTHC